VLIAAQHLVDRLRHPRSRADEIASVRRRLASADASPPSPEEVELALEIARLREALAASFGAVEACGGCARGHPLPHGRFPGGHCCGTRTELVFTDDELAALRLSGTTPAKLVPPPPGVDHAGCAFRGPDGCSLAPRDRPSLCVRFICRELEDELRERGDLRAVKAIASALARAFERFRKLRDARLASSPWPDAGGE